MGKFFEDVRSWAMNKMQLIYQKFESNARELSDKDALIFEQQRFSFSQVQNLVYNLDEVLKLLNR